MTKQSSLLSQNWWQLTTIQIGGAICMPLLIVGQQLVYSYGFFTAIGAIVLGNILLCGLGLIKASLAFHNKKNTIENALYFFGNKRGSLLMGITMLIACTGWFAIQLHIVGISALHLLPAYLQSNASIVSACIIFFGILMTGFSLYGLQGIAKFADLTMPLLIISIGYGVFKAMGMPPAQQAYGEFSFASVAFVLASTLLVVIDIPTYYRVSHSLKDSLLSIGILYLVATPLIQIAGAYIGYHSNTTDMVGMLTADSGIIWQLFIIAFLILAGWTTNNTNIYSSVITLKTIIPSLSERAATILIGTVGTLAALYPLITHYEKTLSAMGILVASMGAVIAINYIWQLTFNTPVSRQLQYGNTVAWLIGVTVGFLSFGKIFTLCNSALCDAFLIASLSTIAHCFLLSTYNNKGKL
jgi:purine-cytosine permease-like protein